jgi:O-acetylhomoserine (thiol)-lyase
MKDFNILLVQLDCGINEKAFKLLNKLEMIIQTANMGDKRTLALHMSSTIYSDLDEEARVFLGIHEGLNRVSIGLEDPQVITNDFLQANSRL